MSRYKFFSPAGFNGVLANVTLEAHANHVAAHGERNALRPGMRRAAGSKDELSNFVGVVQCQQLRDDAAHGVTADNRLFQIQMIENRGSVVGEHLNRIFLYCLAGLAGTSVVEDNDFVVLRKFPYLIKSPSLMIKPGDTAK